jgi:3-oxoacyl-[acyl-carrier protein] reductase
LGQEELVLVGRNPGTLQGGEAVVADLVDPGAPAQIMARAKVADRYPVLVNCAGSGHFGDFSSMPYELIQEQYELNVLAPIRLTQAFVPWALEQGGGQVINVLSIAATTVFAGSVGYCSSKAAALMFTKVLSAEYRAKGLRVTAVIPGSTDTPFWDDKEWKPERADMIPAAEVAALIKELILAPRTRYVDEVVITPPRGIL